MVCPADSDVIDVALMTAKVPGACLALPGLVVGEFGVLSALQVDSSSCPRSSWS
jgi:hypothetical protein